MNQYELIIDDMEMYRQPQSIQERRTVEALTAADAITIGGLRFRFPLSEKLTADGNFHERKLIDVITLEEMSYSEYRKMRASLKV